MLTRLLSPGDKIDIRGVERLRGDGPEDNKKIYYSQVHDILSSDRMEIVMPTEQTKLVLLPVDGVYDLVIYTQGIIYQCFARIVDRYKSNNMYLLAVELTSNIRKYQRREFYRFSCALEMSVRLLDEDETNSVEQNEKTELKRELPAGKAVIVDISGGGLRFISSTLYEADSLVYCKYNLFISGALKEFNIAGKILNVKPMENRKGVYEHRVKYIGLEVEKREEIIRYIFQEERKNRKKETGL